MAAQKDFIVSGYQGKIGGYSVLAGQVARLARHGRVQVNVSGVSGKDFDEVPPGGSPWHEYASYGVGLHKVYPHKKLVPFVNGEFVSRNRRLLRSRLRVLRRHKLGACFSVHEPHFLPEAFFRAYPHLRGPRSWTTRGVGVRRPSPCASTTPRASRSSRRWWPTLSRTCPSWA